MLARSVPTSPFHSTLAWCESCRPHACHLIPRSQPRLVRTLLRTVECNAFSPPPADTAGSAPSLARKSARNRRRSSPGRRAISSARRCARRRGSVRRRARASPAPGSAGRSRSSAKPTRRRRPPRNRRRRRRRRIAPPLKRAGDRYKRRAALEAQAHAEVARPCAVGGERRELKTAQRRGSPPIRRTMA